MTDAGRTVVVIPCSGIGKTAGSVSREAAYELCDALRPDRTRLVALSKLVLGEEEARAAVRAVPSITIDGCKLRCAAKLVELSGGTIAHEVSVLDVYKRNRTLKAEGIAALDAAGLALARAAAEEAALAVDEATSGRTTGEDSDRG